jgi:Peptidase A4 family
MRRLFWASFALVPALGLAAAVSPAVGASTTRARVPVPVEVRAAAAARVALKHLTVGPPPNERVPGHTQRVKGLTMQDSYNWSGYADDNTRANVYSKVSGTWAEPAITCGKEDQIAVFWVGIDGWTSSTVEQAGTLAQCFQGTAHYYTWWEMYPTNSITVVGSTVKPGDKITASVVKTGTKYALKVTDSTTTANTFTITKTCAATTCLATSAEWIAEAPGGPRGEYPLPNFKTWSLTSASTISGTKTGTISAFPDDEVTMIDGTLTYPLASPGALNATGNAFKVTWKNSY